MQVRIDGARPGEITERIVDIVERLLEADRPAGEALRKASRSEEEAASPYPAAREMVARARARIDARIGAVTQGLGTLLGSHLPGEDPPDAAAPTALRKAQVVKIGPHGGKIVGYAHGDHTRPIYEGHTGTAQLYPAGQKGAAPVAADVHHHGGDYAYTTDPAAVPAGAVGVAHMPSGRVVKLLSGPDAGRRAAGAVRELSKFHGHRGPQAHGAVFEPHHLAVVRQVIEKQDIHAVPLSPDAAAPAPETAQPKGPLDVAAVVAAVSKATGLSPQAMRAALTGSCDPTAPGGNQRAAARAKIEGAIHAGGHAVPHALVHLLDGGYHDKAAHAQLVADLVKGGAPGQGAKEYGQTPLYDLQVVSEVRISAKPIAGQAVCYLQTRALAVGPGPEGKHVTGDFRHELGHAVDFALIEAPAAFRDAIDGHWKKAQGAAKKQGTKPPPGAGEDWCETTFGVMSLRGLDNAKEDFAEHYRGYHREALRHRKKKGGQLDIYAERHPAYAAIWDAHYTAALLAAAAAKGEW